MRTYATNSPAAIGRLIAMAILADGRLDNREVDWIKHNDTASLLGVDRDTLIQVLLDCCRDVITEAEQERITQLLLLFSGEAGEVYGKANCLTWSYGGESC